MQENASENILWDMAAILSRRDELTIGLLLWSPLINLGNKQIQVYDIKIKYQFPVGNCAFYRISILLQCEFMLVVPKNNCTKKLVQIFAHHACELACLQDMFCSPYKW